MRFFAFCFCLVALMGFLTGLLNAQDYAYEKEKSRIKTESLLALQDRTTKRGTADCDCGECAIVWRTDYAKAIEESAQTGKPVLVQFTTDNCLWCTKMETGPLKDEPLVKMINSKFIPLKLPSGEVSQAVGVNTFPTLMILEPKTRAIAWKYSGYVEASALKAKLEAYSSPQPQPAVVRQNQSYVVSPAMVCRS